MTADHLLKVLAYYRQCFAGQGYQPARLEGGMMEDAGSDWRTHLLWMCDAATEFVEEGDDEKAFRWLGFIQGTLWAMNTFSLNDLRRHSRPPERGGTLS